MVWFLWYLLNMNKCLSLYRSISVFLHKTIKWIINTKVSTFAGYKFSQPPSSTHQSCCSLSIAQCSSTFANICHKTSTCGAFAASGSRPNHLPSPEHIYFLPLFSRWAKSFSGSQCGRIWRWAGLKIWRMHSTCWPWLLYLRWSPWNSGCSFIIRSESSGHFNWWNNWNWPRLDRKTKKRSLSGRCQNCGGTGWQYPCAEWYAVRWSSLYLWSEALGEETKN